MSKVDFGLFCNSSGLPHWTWRMY